MTVVIVAVALPTGRGREIAGHEVGHTDLAAEILTLIGNRSKTEQSVSLDASVRRRCPKDLS